MARTLIVTARVATIKDATAEVFQVIRGVEMASLPNWLIINHFDQMPPLAFMATFSYSDSLPQIVCQDITTGLPAA